jgi:hypothetical protein
LEPRSDVYTLGIILYALLGGQRPYEVPHNAPWTTILSRSPWYSVL